jgi:hypothetical protein
MSAIPDQISVLDQTNHRVSVLKRIGADTALTEAEYDRLIVEHVDLIADALRQAEVLDASAELRLVATQFENMDVLLAEFHGGELHRLVVVEDKLFVNPEAHRKVLAQLLDYANRLQFEIRLDAVLAAADAGVREALEEQKEQLARILRTGNFLLLVAGDRIRPRLVELMRPVLDRRSTLLSRVELALLSLAIYRGGGATVLVPNVIGAIARGERDMCLEVVVQTDALVPIAARVSLGSAEPVGVPTPVRLQGRRWTRTTFVEQVREDASPEELGPTVHAIERLLDFAEASPSLSLVWGAGKKIGTFTIALAPRPGMEVRLVNCDAHGWLAINVGSLADALGPEAARREVAALSTELDTPIDPHKSYPYLPEDFVLRGDAALDVLERWVQRMIAAVAAA